MVQQIQSACNDCNGSGDFIREKDRCKKCKGKRVLEAEEKLEVLYINQRTDSIEFLSIQVAVAPGMRHNQKIPFKGKADEIVRNTVGPLPCVCVCESPYLSHSLMEIPVMC